MHRPSAKQLTFVYFGFVALSILVIHWSVFYSTAEDMELLYAKMRLKSISEFVSRSVAQNDIADEGIVQVQTQGKAAFDPYIEAYFDTDKVPERFSMVEAIPYDTPYEVVDATTGKTYFVQRERGLGLNDEFMLVLDNSLYELTEEQLFPLQFRQIALSVTLAIASLFVVLGISGRLTRPITLLVDTLTTRSPKDVAPIAVPEGTATREVYQLVDSFNLFQERINNLMERERAFNRYASHELRTPLMVMKGAITLLGESNDREFIDKQARRLSKASDEMHEFIQTLLSLTKLPEVSQDGSVNMHNYSQALLDSLAHQYWEQLAASGVSYSVEGDTEVFIPIPESALKIVVGNLLKNAFAHTRKGKVSVVMGQNRIDVIDSGAGLAEKPQGDDSFGLGLVLVHDICRQFGCDFRLEEKPEGQGCIATITWS